MNCFIIVNKTKSQLLREQGAASIVEYTIVFPLCFLVLIFLFFAGYFLNERAVLDAAAHRSILIAQKLYSDPKFKYLSELENSEDIDYVGYKRSSTAITDIGNEPYRFLFGNDQLERLTKEMIEKKAISCVGANQLFPLGRVKNLNVEVSDITGMLSKSVTVIISEEYSFPEALKIIGLKGNFEMKAAATTSLSAQPELIRNIDLAVEIIQDLGGNDILVKIQESFQKVGNFVKSLGGE